MVANRLHQHEQPPHYQTSCLTANANRSVVRTGTFRRFGAVMAIAALSTTLGGNLQAEAQQPKTAGPAIPKAPASPATSIRPAAVTPTLAAPTAPRAQPARPAAVKTSRPKAKTTPKRAVVKRKVAPKPKAVSTSTGGSGFGQGASGAKVVAVQERLSLLKYDVTSADGKYGDQLYHAVMAFQKVNGLPRTGRVTNQTLAALETATEPTPLIATGGADRIEIDLEKQYLGLYKGGALLRLLSISSGNNKEFCVYDPETKKTECDKAVTPGGSFRVRSRWVGWRESKLGLLYNPLYFNGGIAIHGAPSVPATPASHGCVRIPMISAQWFPEQVGDGMAVYVFGGQEGAPVPLKSKAPADAKVTPTTAPANTLATIPPAGVPAATLPGTPAPPSNTLAPVPTTVVPTTTTTIPPTTTTGLARLLTPIGTPSSTAPPAANGVITGTVITGATTTSVSGATPIATQVTGAATTTSTRLSAIVTSVGATPTAPIATAVVATATTTTVKP